MKYLEIMTEQAVQKSNNMSHFWRTVMGKSPTKRKTSFQSQHVKEEPISWTHTDFATTLKENKLNNLLKFLFMSVINVEYVSSAQ